MNPKNYNPDLVTFYDIRSGNRAEKDTREVNKKGKYKQDKKEASYNKQKEASSKGNTHINNLQGTPIKNNPLGKINYLSYCNRFFSPNLQLL